jgi:hypothetical protein
MKMNNKFYDVIVAKEYISRQYGKEEKKTAWNKIGRAWASQSGDSLSFELFMFPNQRYVVQLKDKNQQQESAE